LSTLFSDFSEIIFIRGWGHAPPGLPRRRSRSRRPAPPLLVRAAAPGGGCAAGAAGRVSPVTTHAKEKGLLFTMVNTNLSQCFTITLIQQIHLRLFSNRKSFKKSLDKSFLEKSTLKNFRKNKKGYYALCTSSYISDFSLDILIYI